MPNTPVPAAGEAMPAANPNPVKNLVDAQDIIAQARNLIECISLAGESLAPDQEGPIVTACTIAAGMLDQATALLSAYQEALS